MQLLVIMYASAVQKPHSPCLPHPDLSSREFQQEEYTDNKSDNHKDGDNRKRVDPVLHGKLRHRLIPRRIPHGQPVPSGIGDLGNQAVLTDDFVPSPERSPATSSER